MSKIFHCAIFILKKNYALNRWEIAVALRLDALQTMLPADHLLLSETQALPALAGKAFPFATMDVGQHDGLSGLSHIDKVISIDQAPIGRTPRSIPASMLASASSTHS